MSESATLEIHQLCVGRGDSALIVNRNLDEVKNRIIDAAKTKKVKLPDEPIDYVPYAVYKGVSLAGTVRTALLIDGGDDEFGGDIVNYLRTYGVVDQAAWCPNLYLLVSHFHADHMDGLRSVFVRKVDPQKPGQKVTFEDRYRPGRVYQTAPHKSDGQNKQNVRLGFNLFNAAVAKAAAHAVDNTQRFFLQPGGLTKAGKQMTIDLGTGAGGIPIVVYAVAGAQSVLTGLDKNGNGTIQEIKSKSKTTDLNDRSIVVMVEYGSFRYFAGGDIAGSGGPAGGNVGANAANFKKKKSYSQHADVETRLGEALEQLFPKTPAWTANAPKYPNDGYCTVMKANHHGSSTSVDVYLLATLQPRLVLISTGTKAQFHEHPTPQVLNRLSKDSNGTPNWTLRGSTNTVPNTVTQVFVTEAAKKYPSKTATADLRGAYVVGDIVVRPVDESVVALQQATAPGPKLEVQVYGSGDQTVTISPATVMHDLVATPAPDKYPIGPWALDLSH
jgi:beta-lactamase superfamily II metal-dependent hydrolase